MTPTDSRIHHDNSIESLDVHLEKLRTAVIMMVDDESINTDVIQIHLEGAGYTNFLITDQSTEAIGLLKRKRPDVLLLDLMMPKVSGFDILIEMRKRDMLKHIPVIVLTSSTDAETKLRVLELGATDFLSKPVDPSELILRLQNTLTAKAYQDQLTYYDSLTGLPNRRLFLDRMNWLINNAHREGKFIGVLHIGLDRFKQINDNLGPRAGDMLLKVVATRISDCLRSTDVITRLVDTHPWDNLARFGGDEFAIILPMIENVDDIAFVARRILESMKPVFNIEENDVYISPSIGIATFPEDGGDTNTLLKHAANATNYAKEQGRNNYQFYSNEINAQSTARMEMESRLRKAVENGEFLLHYQPTVDPHLGRVAGMEALLRWDSPDYGLVYPNRFIPLAEESGLIAPIGNWVLQEACRQITEWQSEGLRDLYVSVNISVEQLHKQDFSLVLEHVIGATGIDPGHLVMEITESLVLNNTEKHIRTLHRFKELGVDISIDDFGTGYSSLSYLTRFPVDELKIDRSFVANIHSEPNHQAIGRTIIALAQSLDLRVVAEGVEELEPLNYLIEQGCDLIQGYYYSKPLPKDEFPECVRSINERLRLQLPSNRKKVSGLIG